MLAKELVETYLGSEGAMDARTLGSSSVLLLISVMIRAMQPDDERPKGTGKPVLAVDLDECCCGYVPAFILFMNAKYGTSLALEDFTSYTFWEVPKCNLASREEAMDRVYEFHASKCAQRRP